MNFSKYILLGLLFATSCERDPAPLPVTPEEPNANFSAVINGNAWVTDAPIGSPEIDAEHYLGNYFDVTGFKYSGPGISHIFIKVFGLNDTGTFVLNETNIAEYYDSPNNKRYKTDAIHSGSLRITAFDYPNAKVTGEFEFVARDSASGDTAVITSGEITNVTFHKY